MSDKTSKISISMPESFLEAVEKHISGTNEDRSEFFRRAAAVELSAHGALPGAKKAELRTRFEQLLDADEARAEQILSNF